MTAYIVRRVLLMIPTLFGLMLVSFMVVQFAPGGPVERIIAQLSGSEAANSKYRGAQGLDPEFIASLEKQFGFDKPAYERFLLMLWNYSRFDFGKSYFRDTSVLTLIREKMPVSISLGLWLTLL